MSVTYSGTLAGSDGSKLTISGAQLTPAPVTPPVPGPAGRRQISVYVKMWRRSDGPTLADVAVPGVTEVRLAFLQGDPLAMVGWGRQDQAGAAGDRRGLFARNVDVTASIGGERGSVNTSNREGCLTGIGRAADAIGINRIDWDVEASALRPADVLAISQAAWDRWGIRSTMAPNGSNVSQYLPVAVELHRRGLLAAYGQQFYGSAAGVSLSAARGRIAESVKAGIPARLTQVGMWVGSTQKQWTMSTCEANLRAIRAEWDDIGGAYLWSETHAETAEWARRMAAVLA